MEPPRIELSSDTQTRPTAGMREAMANAEVGDEQRGEDPTVNALCARMAELMGKEAAVFLPSGTMANQIAFLVHCRPGDEILAEERYHVINLEGAGAAALAGAFVRPISAPRGIFTAEQLEARIRKPRRETPRPRVVTIEQTVNFGSGAIWPVEAIHEVAAVARRHGLLMHMDGARLLNAAVASGVSAASYCEAFDSVWLDLSKGLGCPVGAVLAGSEPFISEAWVWKQRLGGAMRQAGVLAAAGLYALAHHVERMTEDHDNARLFAERIAGLPGVHVAEPIETNIVLFDINGMTAEALVNALAAKGIRLDAIDTQRLRAVTHLDVNRAQVEEAAAAVAEIMGG
ncbi:threonine aldolase family protein [Dichotomicrobium thermohalophilum]|uniref:L-threonine aldolase n=1 Tax=Dichotomicrobium thermohalophilum TaxID=933063 RepID=A0A397Q183_9HYPH|nr:threonine aldolase family protein [Dichotomicrobium thermohalophilum]RIA55270.1 L-threonine aldolase [Dichotomicrobium thermohalophilum]